MGANHPTDTEAKPIPREELQSQIAESKRLQAEAVTKADRGIETAGRISRVLKELAGYIDQNPSSWDELFGMDERRRP